MKRASICNMHRRCAYARGEASGEPSAANSALQPLAQELVAARAVHAEAISAAQTIFDGARGGAPVRRDVAERVVHNLNDTILRSPEASLLLMQARRFDGDLSAKRLTFVSWL
jgi:hypothetical protein